MSPGHGRILAAMSGGVDSSVAAARLVEEGWDVVGATMKTFCYSGTPQHTRSCCGLDGITDARRVADRLGIPHYVFDVEEDFTRAVIDDFVTEYAQGRTPNPCVRCNSDTKFAELLRRGRALGCERIASGHYARTAIIDGEASILRGVDTQKDQAYFLWGLPRELIPRLCLPLGAMTKGEVRQQARLRGLGTADKPESQEICFVPTGDYRDLLRRRLARGHPALEPGDIVRTDGAVVGRHDGYAGFTIGQRRGLGGGFPEPTYVIEIRPEAREVVVGPREELSREGVEVGDLNWIAPPPSVGSQVNVQMRHRSPAVPARVIRGEDEADATGSTPRLTLRFEHPQGAVAPGQSAVIFRGERVLGGGRVRHTMAVPAGH